MCDFRVSVWHHLEEKCTILDGRKTKWSKPEKQLITNLIRSTHLVLTQYFNARAKCHQGLVNVS